MNPAWLAVPDGVVTLTDPELPAPTTAFIEVAEITVKELAAVPPKLTAVALVKLVPVMVIVVPVAPEKGATVAEPAGNGAIVGTCENPVKEKASKNKSNVEDFISLRIT